MAYVCVLHFCPPGFVSCSSCHIPPKESSNAFLPYVYAALRIPSVIASIQTPTVPGINKQVPPPVYSKEIAQLNECDQLLCLLICFCLHLSQCRAMRILHIAPTHKLIHCAFP